MYGVSVTQNIWGSDECTVSENCTFQLFDVVYVYTLTCAMNLILIKAVFSSCPEGHKGVFLT